MIEKLTLTLVTAVRKLRPYFQCHSIIVTTAFPLRSILHKPKVSGRLMKWVVELGEFDITNQNRTTLKYQVLANFATDLTPEEASTQNLESPLAEWTLQVDGSSNMKSSGIDIYLKTPTGEIIEQSFSLDFKASDNEAEYEVMVANPRFAKALARPD